MWNGEKENGKDKDCSYNIFMGFTAGLWSLKGIFSRYIPVAGFWLLILLIIFTALFIAQLIFLLPQPSIATVIQSTAVSAHTFPHLVT